MATDEPTIDVGITITLRGTGRLTIKPPAYLNENTPDDAVVVEAASPSDPRGDTERAGQATVSLAALERAIARYRELLGATDVR